jgi:hypothetical protein
MKSITIVSLFLVLVSGQCIGAELITRTCGVKLINTLHRLESKSDEPLEIFELMLSKDASSYFQNQSLTKVDVPMLTSIAGIYRRDPVAKRAFKVFSDLRFSGPKLEKDLPKLLKPDTFYTYVVHDDKIRFAQTRPGKVRDYGSKHAMLRDQNMPLRLAGEFWVDKTSRFHFDGSSGTFLPTNTQVEKGIPFFKEHLGIEDAQVHYFSPPPKALTEPIDKSSQLTRNYLISTGLVKTVSLSSQDLSSLNGLDKQVVELKNEKGEKVQYNVVKTNTVIVDEKIYDTPDETLQKKKAEIKVSSVYEKGTSPQQKSRIPSSEVSRFSKSLGVDNSTLNLRTVKREEDTELVFYGKNAKPVLRMNLVESFQVDPVTNKITSPKKLSAQLTDEGSEQKVLKDYLIKNYHLKDITAGSK